ncbi:hypothetical protein FACS189447_03480 [Spirochaetia bacterium]|nr:hypothetical protein FACS189447_03480 [Spirochaetia bacterium]
MLKKFLVDNITEVNALLLANIMGVIDKREPIIEKVNPFSYADNTIRIKKGNVIPIRVGNIWKVFVVLDDEILTEANLDAPSSTFQVGTDYAIYLVDDDADGRFSISANLTFPAGANADNSRKYGGFHYGHIRKVSADGLNIPIDSEGVAFGTGSTNWKNNVVTGIVWNSVWDIQNRPKCSPEGMVKIGNLWVDIYQSSAAEPITLEGGTNGQHVSAGRLQSKYGMLPVTGTEGLNWYNFAELAARAGKKMLTYREWIAAAYGNPGGEDGADNYGWTKTSNSARARTGCRVSPGDGSFDAASGIKPYAISALNCVDCVGNVYEWLDSIFQRDTGTWGWKNVLGAGKGQVYAPNDNNPGAAIAGGHWLQGVHAGPRCVSLGNYAWNVNPNIGVRLACDNL